MAGDERANVKIERVRAAHQARVGDQPD